MSAIKLEICVDSIASLNAAAAGGADRIELCTALSEGGLTPSFGFMQAAAALDVSTHVMIRPRGGDFCYSQAEIDVMCADIATAKQLGLAGVVLGVANHDDTLDLDALAKLRAAATDMQCTLHRVVDLTPDIFEATEQAIGLGFDRILTSGGAKNAQDGKTSIAEMVHLAAGRIEIMPGSGVTVQNVNGIIAATGVCDVHASCSEAKFSHSGKVEEMAFSAPDGVRMTSRQLVEKMRAKVDSVGLEAAHA